LLGIYPMKSGWITLLLGITKNIIKNNIVNAEMVFK
jgi:hypothetical protein